MPDGSVSVAYPLAGGDGPRSDKPVTVAPNGVVYAVGPNAVYRLGLTGQLTVLHTLDGTTEGSDLTA
ncbi:MAG TPA: hypothetical protein VLA16_03775 [Ideonella sp.]|nr:hypothetical protein [Ideonella sp.]